MISVVLLSMTILLLCFVLKKQKDGRCLEKAGDSSLPLPPGPKPLPFLGSLHLLANRKIPFEAFTSLRQEFGSIVSIRLGTTACVVLQDEQSIHQALVTKAEDFDSRPNFLRLHLMFGGSKKNVRTSSRRVDDVVKMVDWYIIILDTCVTLAFCDYDELQKVRKKILAMYTFPRYLSHGWRKLDQTFSDEMPEFLSGISSGIVDLKPLMSKACSNIFNSYFCDISRRAYNDEDYNNYVSKFDKIFWEVNNGRMVDFIPELMPVMGGVMKEVTSWCAEIRDYVMENIVNGEERVEGKDNMLEALLQRVKKDDHLQNADTKLTLDGALYALEDILGGHCAVSNITLRMLRYIGQNPEIQDQLIRELDTEFQGGQVRLEDVTNVQFLTATFYETLRLTSSAIVPHMTNKDTSVGGFFVPENTVVFINNHYSNFSTDYWEDPDKFDPNRFIDDNGKMKKPQHFLPFSTGRRSCIGSKMVQLVSTSLTATILRTFRIECEIPEVPLGMLALPVQPTEFQLIDRQPAACSVEPAHPTLMFSPSHPSLSMLIGETDNSSFSSLDSSTSSECSTSVATEPPTFYICPTAAVPTKTFPSQESSIQKMRHNSSQDEAGASSSTCAGLSRTISASSLPKMSARLRHASSR